MQKNDKDSVADAKRSWVSFILATLCASPFVLIFFLWMTGMMFKKQALLNYVLLPFLFAWPILGLLSIVGLISIFFAWSKHPKLQALLFFYGMILVLISILFFIGIMHMGPL